MCAESQNLPSSCGLQQICVQRVRLTEDSCSFLKNLSGSVRLSPSLLNVTVDGEVEPFAFQRDLVQLG